MSELMELCPFCGSCKSNLRKHPETCFLHMMEEHTRSECTIWNVGEIILAWNTRADGWIRVEDRLPEDGNFVDIYGYKGNETNKSYFRAVDSLYVKKDKKWDREITGVFTKVTHWMRPEPPKGEAE